MTQTVWEMVAIDTPVEGSPPYAAGKTTVFSPNGVPKAKKHIVSAVLFAPKSFSITTNSAGRINSLNTDAI